MFASTLLFLSLYSGGYHTVAERQANTPCNVQMDCFPANLTGSRYNVSTDLINCVNNVCVCSQSCFYLNGSTCGYSKCGWYAPATNVCTPIDQISGDTVYLLSAFLSGVGAANFYIGQNGLGKYSACNNIIYIYNWNVPISGLNFVIVVAKYILYAKVGSM